METIRGLNLMSLCRLCGVRGNHRIDVFGGEADPGPSNRNTLSEKILRCVEVRVERSDKTTKICGNCLCKVYDYDQFVYDYNQFRGICAATNATMGKSNPLRSVTNVDSINDVIEMRETHNVAAHSSKGIVSQNRTSSSDPSIECILIDDDSSSDCDETSAESQIAGNNRLVTNVASTSKQGNLEENPENVESDNRKMRGSESRSAVPLSAMYCDEGDELTSGSDDESEIIAIGASESNSKKKHQQAETPMYRAAKYQRFRVMSGSNGDVDGETGNAHTSQYERSFESWHAMMQHEKTYHAKRVKRTFECHLCKKTLMNKRNLQSHMNSLHTPNIRFMCPIRSCSKIFTRKSNLKKHTDAVHIKKLAFKCLKCPMKFNEKQQLTRHLANKHGRGITFACYLCKSSFGYEGSLKIHMDSLHTYQPRFKCPFSMCLKSFNVKSNLTKHINAMHTKDTMPKCLANRH